METGKRKHFRFGVIGGGLMGKEFAVAASRFLGAAEDVAIPEIVGICEKSEAVKQWFLDNVPTVKYATDDYHELLNKDDIDCIYCAVPHIMHEQMYCDIIKAGKHLLGEKPFGIDKQANANIIKTAKEHPEVFVRCVAQFPYFPGCQRLINWLKAGKAGRIMEIRTGFNHCSDMDLTKPLNWKRDIRINGEYGCLGDLGLHVAFLPIRMGFLPKSVYGSFQNIATERPDGKGGMAKCETWDNALLCCDVEHDGYTFPLYLETKRMKPCATNEWYIEVYGLEGAARFSTEDPNAFWYSTSEGKNQSWCRINIGYQSTFKTITGDIFEFGFPDAIFQMWISYMLELEGKPTPFGLCTAEETAEYHKIATAALQSQKEKRVVEL